MTVCSFRARSPGRPVRRNTAAGLAEVRTSLLIHPGDESEDALSSITISLCQAVPELSACSRGLGQI